MPPPRARSADQARRERAGAGRRRQAHRARGPDDRARGHVWRRQVLPARQERAGVRQGRERLQEPRRRWAKSSPPAATTTSSPRPGRAGTRSRRPMRPKYQRFAELANEGARELGFEDVGVLWRSRYDMPAADFEKEAARLYDQVRPLYEGLHCYARGKLAEEIRRGQGAGRQTHPGAPVRQHVGPAVEPHLRRPAEALSRGQHRNRRPRAAEAGLGRGAHDQVRRDLLHLDRIPGAAADLLGALHAHASARPRSGVPRQRLGHGRQGRRAHQDVHEAHRGRPVHDLPRARPRLLLRLVQGPARAVPGRRARRLPRSHRRCGQSVGDARLPHTRSAW